MYAYVPHMCFVPMEVRVAGFANSYEYPSMWLWGPNLGYQQELQALLTDELSVWRYWLGL